MSICASDHDCNGCLTSFLPHEIVMSRKPRPVGFVPARRRALRAIAAAALLPAAAVIAQPATLAPTPSQPEGPFYPKKFPADVDSDLTRIAGRAESASGT